MEFNISKAEKDNDNSCVIITSEQGDDLISCEDCRLGEIDCEYLKSKWGINPCLYKKGVRIGRGLEPDPRDVVRIIQNNLAVYTNMIEQEAPFLKAEKEILERFLKTETDELEKAKAMLYGQKKQGKV